MSEVNVFKPFKEDEGCFRTVDKQWDREALLAQDGVFYLKDILELLELNPLVVKRKAKEVHLRGGDAYKELGVRKIWKHWIVRMKVFAPYYRKYWFPKVRKVDPSWDGNVLLRQRGMFLLTDVCKLLPFTTNQLRYQAKRNPKSKEEFGIWKDGDVKAFVVDMERFSPWIRSRWQRHSPRK